MTLESCRIPSPGSVNASWDRAKRTSGRQKALRGESFGSSNADISVTEAPSRGREEGGGRRGNAKVGNEAAGVPALEPGDGDTTGRGCGWGGKAEEGERGEGGRPGPAGGARPRPASVSAPEPRLSFLTCVAPGALARCCSYFLQASESAAARYGGRPRGARTAGRTHLYITQCEHRPS